MTTNMAAEFCCFLDPDLIIQPTTLKFDMDILWATPDGNIAAFYDFHEVKAGSEEIRYEPGAELLFRCIDIGKFFSVIRLL